MTKIFSIFHISNFKKMKRKTEKLRQRNFFETTNKKLCSPLSTAKQSKMAPILVHICRIWFNPIYTVSNNDFPLWKYCGLISFLIRDQQKKKRCRSVVYANCFPKHWNHCRVGRRFHILIIRRWKHCLVVFLSCQLVVQRIYQQCC